jgi:hypothetical protein
MPRISDTFTECAVYIYSSVEDARDGTSQGGSGFLVGVPSEKHTGFSFIYVVTNWHVVLKANTPILRMNRKDTGVENFPTELDAWVRHPDGDDIAAFPIVPEIERMRFISVSVSNFLTHDLALQEDVGIGDDVFMVGRFIGHDGKQRNAPAVRFGNIAMMPTEKIISESGIEQEAFLVEARSLPGYSGSAVFLYASSPMNDMSRTRLGAAMDAPKFPDNRAELAALAMKQMSAKGPYLLGIDWCHLNNEARVRDKQGNVLAEGWSVSENTGMAGVIPAWKIAELLNCDELVEWRRLGDQHLSEAGNSVSLD